MVGNASLEKEVAELQAEMIRKNKIIAALTNRVKRSIHTYSNAYTMFENNILLQDEVNKKTEKLQVATLHAQEANRSKSRFLANMSHEIRTPMNAIIGLSSLLLDSEMRLEQKDYVEKINQSGKSLLRLINDILDFSKIEAGKFSLDEIPFVVADVFEHIENVIIEQAHEKGLELIFDLGEDLFRQMVGDPLRLKQIFVNLVGNAIKFTDNGQVTVSAHVLEQNEEKVEVQFRVKDDGIGMEKSTQEIIFHSFHQADNSITRKYGGTGLGLSITKVLVEMMGGEINVVSSPGMGSEFIFTAVFKPLATSHKREIALSLNKKKKVFSKLRRISGAKILLVEDNLINQLVATSMLEKKGFFVRVAENGRDAVDILQKESFDCVLMDIEMPVMDGYTATKILRQEKRFANLPILAITANAYDAHKERCLAAGMNSHVGKPIEDDILYAELVKWIDPGKISSAQKSDAEELKVKDVEQIQAITSVEGLDVQTALARLDGDNKLYSKLLRTFRVDHVGDYELVQKCIALGRIDEARRLVHSLKGVAPIIGSQGLARITLDFDDVLSRRLVERYSGLLAVFHKNLDSVLLSIKDYFDNNPEEEVDHSSNHTLDSKELFRRFYHLRGLLDSMDLEAHSYSTELCKYFPKEIPFQLKKKFESSLANFDYEQAIIELAAIEKQIRKEH